MQNLIIRDAAVKHMKVPDKTLGPFENLQKLIVPRSSKLDITESRMRDRAQRDEDGFRIFMHNWWVTLARRQVGRGARNAAEPEVAFWSSVDIAILSKNHRT